MISILFFTILACTLMCIVTSFTLKDAFDVLGVENIDDAKKAYYKLAAMHHPDRNFGHELLAAEKFKKINEAYSVVKKTQEPLQRTDSIQRKDSIQRTASQMETLPSVVPSKMTVTIDNLKGGLSSTGASMAGMILAGTIGNVIAPDTFQKIPLDLIGNQLLKTTVTSTVVPNLCGNSIECNVIGAILTNTVMDSHFSNNKKVEVINGAKITLKKQIKTLKDLQDSTNNKIPQDVKANMELLRDRVYDDVIGSNFMPKKIGKTELVISKNGVKVCEILVNSNYVVSIFDIKSDYIIHVFKTSEGTQERVTIQDSDDVFPSSVIKSASHLSDVIKQIHLTVERILQA